MADVIVEEPQSQADTAEPEVSGRGEVLRSLDRNGIPEPAVHACADLKTGDAEKTRILSDEPPRKQK
jgi:hypothetical protein